MSCMWRSRLSRSGSRDVAMILEALNFVATWLTTGRRNGEEINSSVRLWARARRCARDWAEHEENCKTFVCSRMPAKGRVAVVLGSGLLRDVPIEGLAEAFGEVRLFDLQHLASVRIWAWAKGFRNLRFEQRDLSTGLDFLRDDPEIEFVVSANLLSQLGVAADRIGADAAATIASHVAGLRAAPGRKLLLTDSEYEVIRKDGTVAERYDLMHGVSLPAADAGWHWPVAPYGELDPTCKAVHRVSAIRL